ncbi:MAG: hypothetical protein K2G02_04960, partial [Phocaeicola sp.]|nr:hypothetical protein [Phocaeicola sp.]
FSAAEAGQKFPAITHIIANKQAYFFFISFSSLIYSVFCQYKQLIIGLALLPSNDLYGLLTCTLGIANITNE